MINTCNRQSGDRISKGKYDHDKKYKMKTGNILLGVLAGLATGAAIGILFAPAKGVQTRKRMMSKGDDIADELREKFDEMIESVNEKYHMVMQETADVVSKQNENHSATKKEHHNSTS